MFELNHHTQRITSLLRDAREVLIITHQKPDGDAVGSATALAGFLVKLGSRPTIFCLHTPPEQFHFLPNLHYFTHDASAVSRRTFDLVVVLDSSDLAHAGADQVLPGLATLPPLINIDHHASNIRFGDYHLIDPQSPSTTALLFRLFSHHHRHLIDHHIATSLLTGLLTDTSHFSNPATNAVALSMGSELLKYGARFRTITSATWQQREVSTLQVWGHALAQLHYLPQYRIAVSVLTHDDSLRLLSESDPTEGIANFLSHIKDADIILLLKDQNNGTIRGSLRTVRDDIDVARIANVFGGGGHKKAAGFKIRGTLTETEQGWKIV